MSGVRSPNSIKISFYTLGCRLNQAETEKMVKEAMSRNFYVVDFRNKADIYIINTCSVTALADRKSRAIIYQAKRQNPKAKIIVVGCGAPSLKSVKDLKADFFIPNKDKEKTLEIIEKKFSLKKTKNPSIKMKSRTRALIKIQDGCNNFCTYCVVPYLRGREKSRSISEVIKEIKEREREDYKEIVLTGVNIGRWSSFIKISKDKQITPDTSVETPTLRWGNIKNQKYNIVKLVNLILKETKIPRIHLSSIEPIGLDENFIDLFKNPRICPHLHISLQSGSNSVLKRMNRGYTTKGYADLVKRLRKVNPDISITTDIIVGFPGETEKEFKETLSFAKKIGFSKIHIFRFSPRPGTVASMLSNQIPEKTKKEQAKKLNDLAKKLEENYKKKFIGRNLSVLFEEKKGGFWTGLGSNYIRVKVKSKKNLKNQIKKVKFLLVN